MGNGRKGTGIKEKRTKGTKSRDKGTKGTTTEQKGTKGMKSVDKGKKGTLTEQNESNENGTQGGEKELQQNKRAQKE